MSAPSKLSILTRSMLSRIASGDLQPGERLPSVREAAVLFGVSKNTAVEAYLRLVAQGVLTAKPGSGYYVTRSGQRGSQPQNQSVSAATDRASLLTEQLERRLKVRPGDGRLPPDWLEESELRRYLSTSRFQDVDAYNSAWGFLPLRRRLCGALAERGISCQPDQMLMTHGANHAMDLIIRRHVSPGDAVLVDDPGYYPLFAKLTLAGARIIGVPRREDGPDVEALDAAAGASGARLFFTQSLAHNPTGGSITPGAAYGVLKVANARDLIVVEDDPFADILPYTTPRLAALDQLDRVIYLGTFSKTLAASFRVGYVAASRQRAAEINELKVITAVSTSGYDERLIFGLIDQGHYLKHLRRLRSRVSKATTGTLSALAQAGHVIKRPIGGGFYVWLKLPIGTDMAALNASAADSGVFIAPGAAFSASPDPATANGMRINVAYGADPQFIEWLQKAI